MKKNNQIFNFAKKLLIIQSLSGKGVRNTKGKKYSKLKY